MSRYEYDRRYGEPPPRDRYDDRGPPPRDRYDDRAARYDDRGPPP
eukprot:CAMPEP_0198313784 /NCGR_PEP_ID=MMETSP1450-20131203/4690_1 /TAXON_ID=753684 ORGANISM="Madagascaria erythrocladiodes, Strain CCMP3234" /NCGR_SAMPLE_ID=MMETSP1450 /ASSEMBLY_ACC=CAM_ASM_001115 /LENGTH=44 /DNA_ID= /DNA_START= /DNA_END= /DNA_ORIENTATION=